MRGGGYDDAPAQTDEDAEGSEPVEDKNLEEQENSQKAEETTTEEETADDDTGMFETTDETENLSEAETPTQTQEEETDTDETAANMDEGETAPAKMQLTNVQNNGYYIMADLENCDAPQDYRIYWKGIGREKYEGNTLFPGGRAVIAPLKPNTEYVLHLKYHDSDDVLYEKNITTRVDYQFIVETPITSDNVTVTANSAQFHVKVTDYKGAYPNQEGSFARLYAGTEYQDASGKTVEASDDSVIYLGSQTTECTMTVSLDNLKADTEYTLPIWVSEYRDEKAMRKKVGDVTFRTAKSDIAEKVKLEATPDETDKTKVNYTLSLDPSLGTEGLKASYECPVFYKIKNEPQDEFTYLEENAILSSDNNYQYEGSITGLCTGTVYELNAVVDGVVTTADFETEADGMTFACDLSPLSFGAKMNIALTGVSETSERYRVKAYVKNKEGSWKPIDFYTKEFVSSESDVALTPANGYQGERLAASGEWIGANASYEMRVDLENASGTVMKRKYDTLVTSKISLKTSVGDIAGREATITCELEEPDEAFDWIGVPAAADVYYRKKDSDAVWYKEDTFNFLKNKKHLISIRNLDVDTEYEVKITSADDQDNIYAETIFQTTEGTAEGVLGDVDVHFNGFYIDVEGTYTPSDFAEKTEIRLVECDSAGKVLTQSESASLGSNKRFYISGALRMETVKVQIEVTETQKGADGSLEEKKYQSPEYIREKVPDGTFSIADVSTGVSAVRANLTYTGDLCFEEDSDSSQRIYATLYYNARGESAQEERNASVYYDLGDKSKIVTFNGFAEDTAYEGRFVVYVKSELSGSAVNVYEQEIKQEEFKEFTTKKNETYPLEATFPDAQFRELIKYYAWLGSDATEITTAQLERITVIYQERRDFDTEPIKDLTGIELLTGLEQLIIENHEVSDVSEIDWSKLMALRNFNLRGNDLTMIPDLSKNRNLREVSLLENEIPAEEFATASAKLPEGMTLDSTTQSLQRVDGVPQVIVEETYYQRAGKSPLLIRVSGHKTRLPYEFRYTVDGNAVTFDRKVYDDSDVNRGISCCTDTGLAVGPHTLTVEMYAKTEKEFTKTIDFQIAEGGAYLEKTPYRFNARQSLYNVAVCSEKPVSAVYMQKGGSVIAAASDIHSAVSDMEYRYQTLGSSGIRLEGLEAYESGAPLECVRSQKPDAGTYDLRVVYEDGTQEILEGVIALFDKAFVEGGMIGYDYDSTGDSFYLYVMGDGFDASKMEYAFTSDEGKRQTAEYVNQKEVSGGYIVKFRKADTWTPNVGSTVEVKLTPKDGYEVSFDNDTFLADISQGIYYCAYNEASNKVEVGVTANLKREDVGFALARYDSREDAAAGNGAQSIAVNAQIVSETVSYLVPMKDGAVYKLPAGYYRLDMTCGDYREHKEVVVKDGVDTNYWVGSRYAGAGDITVSFYSEVAFAKENGVKDFRAELTGEALSSPRRAKRVWTYGYNENSLTAVGMTFDLSALTQGDYTVTLRYRDETLSTYTVTVLPTDKFVITDDGAPYVNWIDDSSFGVSFDTINAAESDAFTVTLTDLFGNQVDGLTTEVSNIDSGTVSLKVTGLRKKDAYKNYYVKVTHNTLGEAYQTDGTTAFFAEERGKYMQIYDVRFTWESDNNRVVGIGMYSGIAFPVTVKVYQTHDTREIAAVTVNEGDLEKKTGALSWYYFKQALMDALSDADALYDVVAVDADGRLGILRRKPLGVCEEVLGEWTVSPTQISLSLDSDEAKAGTITVEGNKDTAVFVSDNQKVVTVATDEADENKAVVTAVAEGTANISVTVGTVTKTVAVTVTKEHVNPTGISVTAPESVSKGDKVEIRASVEPAAAWTQESSITWTSSDTSVISVPAGSTGLVVEADALKAGTAVITAALDGTEFTASCEITVAEKKTWTVSPTQLGLSLDSDEAKVGTITVEGNKDTPVFVSDNEAVVTVTVDEVNKNRAVVTAVAAGTANISITADKITKTVVVTVTKEHVNPTGISITAPESVSAGGKAEICASVQPVGAWTQQSSITWMSSDTSVISIPAGSTGLVVEADALKEGTAVVTAALDGTEFSASCEITVVENGSGDNPSDNPGGEQEIGTLYFLEGADSTLADIKLPEGWNWENPAEVLKADNSHPVQDFMAVYSKDDVFFEQYLDVYVSRLDTVRIVGKGTVSSGKEARYLCDYTYIGANPANGYDIDWQWTAGANLALSADTGERITAKVSGNDTLSVKMTVTNTITGKTVFGNAEYDIAVGEIPDSEPRLENKKIIIYKNSTQHVPIGLVARDGNSITAVDTKDADFKTEKDENGEWLIWLANGSNYTRKTNKTLSLTVMTEAGTEYQKKLGVTVDVTEITAKNVKFKQTVKPNAAYSSTDTVRAEFSVGSKYVIEDIAAVKEDSGKFAVKSFNAATGTLVLEAKASELDKDAKRYPAKVQVKVRDYGTWTLDVSVAVQNKKPSLKLGGAVILKGVTADASVALYSGKTEVSWDDYTFKNVEGNGVTLTKDAGMLKAAYTGDRNGTYQVTIRKNTWAPNVELVLKGRISVFDLKKAKLGADLPKITVNISEGYIAPVTIAAGIQGSSIAVDLKAEPEKDKDKQALTAEVLGGGKIRITPQDGAKKGSYKVKVSGTVNGTAVKGLTIKVTLTDKAPEVKLSAKGKINLANREGTSIVYTPTLKNLPETLSIKNVRMDRTAADSGYFDVKLTDDGKVVLTTVTGKAMNPKTKYKPVLTFILSNGKTVKTNGKFTVSVTNRLPKVTVMALSSALCSTDTAHRAAYKLNAGNGYTISNVTTDDANCKVTFDGGTDTVYVSLSENANVTAGKKYTVPCTVYIKGADNATKPLTVKLKAVVY